MTASYPETLRAAEEAELGFSVRSADLDFLHSHARDDTVALRAGTLSFVAHFPADGRYRAFNQFQHRGIVHTAAFTLPTVSAGAAMAPGGHTGH